MQTEDSKDTDSKTSPDSGSRPAPDAPEQAAEQPRAEDKAGHDQPAQAAGTEPEAPPTPPDTKPTAAPAESGRPAGAAGESPKLVVAVDDDAEFTASLRTYFEGRGMQVKTFASKAELAEWNWDLQPALFIVDLNLGGEDGRSLALDAQEQGKLRTCPIVLLTDAEMDRETRAFSLKLGFRRILKKPVQFEVLERVITDESRQRSESRKAETADKETDQKAFAERKAAVLRKMGLDETQDAEGPVQKAPDAAQEGPPATKRVSPPTARVAASPATAKAKTAAVGVPGEPSGLATKKEHESCWLRGVALGFLIPAALAVPLAFLPWGYTNPIVLLEGVVLGTLVGIGLSSGLRRLHGAPSGGAVILSVLLLTLAAWGVLLGLRAMLDMPFVEYSEAARQHLHDPGRTIGLAEYTAIAYIAAHWILSVAAATFVVRRTLRALALAESRAPGRSSK